MDLFLNFTILIPVASFSFVIFLLLYRIYTKIRSKFSIKVNCWFCNQNTNVPYKEFNSWMCPTCKQYNGFTKDGDYNREMSLHFNEKTAENIRYCKNITNNVVNNVNGLCGICNENQRVKIEKLSQFEPENESSYEYELNIFRNNLESQFRLCVQCENHVKKTLREKKKMILGSKLIQNHFNINSSISKLKNLSKVIHKKRNENNRTRQIIIGLSSFCLFFISLLNFYFVLNDFAEISRRDSLNSEKSLWNLMVISISHILATVNTTKLYLSQLLVIPSIIHKSFLYAKTITILLIYTAGFRLQTQPFNSWFMKDHCPVMISIFGIILAFICNLLNGFKINRFTILLSTWSTFALLISSSLWNQVIQDNYLELLKLLLSITIVILSIPRKQSKWKYLFSENDSNRSFHRIHSENYMNESNSISGNLYNSSSNISDSSIFETSSQNLSMNSNFKTSKYHSFDQNSLKSMFSDSLNSTLKPSSLLSFASVKSRFPNLSSTTSTFKNYSDLNQSTFSTSSVCSFKTAADQFSLRSASMNRTLNSNPLLEKYMSPLLINTTNNSVYNPCHNESTLNLNQTKINEQNHYRNLLNTSRVDDDLLSHTSSRFHKSLSISNIDNKNRHLLNIASQDYVTLDKNNGNLSRESSQSSGFESLATNAIDNRNLIPLAPFVSSCENSHFDADCCVSPIPSSASEMNFNNSTSIFLPSSFHNGSDVTGTKSFIFDKGYQNERNNQDSQFINRKPDIFNNSILQNNVFKHSPLRSSASCYAFGDGQKSFTNSYNSLVFERQSSPFSLKMRRTNPVENNHDPFNLNSMGNDISSIQQEQQRNTILGRINS